MPKDRKFELSFANLSNSALRAVDIAVWPHPNAQAMCADLESNRNFIISFLDALLPKIKTRQCGTFNSQLAVCPALGRAKYIDVFGKVASQILVHL